MRRTSPARSVPGATLLGAAATLLVAGGCALLPGGGSPGPEDPSCWILVRNEVDWGVRVTLYAPDGRPPIVFDRELGYFEREAERVVEIPCGYRSALVRGRVSRVSGLSGQQRTRFRRGLCLIPGDTVPAVLDEYADWNERWFEDCPDIDLDGGGPAAERTEEASGAVR